MSNTSRQFAATYDKTTNVITVELSESEIKKYRKILNNVDLRRVENHYQFQIPCGYSFYRQTQRRAGNQPWGPMELRQAVRAGVANFLVPWNGQLGAEAFKLWKREWARVYQGLLRNVRLKFPNRQHPRFLTRAEQEYRKQWRKRHCL